MGERDWNNRDPANRPDVQRILRAANKQELDIDYGNVAKTIAANRKKAEQFLLNDTFYQSADQYGISRPDYDAMVKRAVRMNGAQLKRVVEEYKTGQREKGDAKWNTPLTPALEVMRQIVFKLNLFTEATGRASEELSRWE